LERWFKADLLPRFSGRVLSVTQTVGDRWGVLSAQRQLAGIALSAADDLIAATALEHDLTLVTRNVKDFADPGVAVLNPWNIQP
jgi:predicted nucleic acid-binding protein